MSRKLTPEQEEERRNRRARRSIDAAAKVEDLRTWRARCIAAAEAARTKAAVRRAKARKEDLAAGGKPRGVDRVPAQSSLQREPRATSAAVDHIHRVSKHDNPIDSTLGVSVVEGMPVTGNHAYRRQVGARGHERTPRLRTLRAERKRIAQVAALRAELERAAAEKDQLEPQTNFLKRWAKSPAGAR